MLANTAANTGLCRDSDVGTVIHFVRLQFPQRLFILKSNKIIGFNQVLETVSNDELNAQIYSKTVNGDGMHFI